MAGPIKRRTSNYSLVVPRFDIAGWGTFLERNFDVIDAVLYIATGVTSVVGVWEPSTAYVVGDRVIDNTDNTVWECAVNHTSGTGTFETDRTDNPTHWDTIISGVAARGEWQTGITYHVNDFVYDPDEAIAAYCLVEHTSTTSIRDDIANWGILADLGSAVEAAETAVELVAAAETAWKGAWTTATAYVKNDKVSNGGSSYIALSAHTSGATFADDLSGGKWDVLAEKGATGPSGPGSGDMSASTYDPTGVAQDAFNMRYMVESAVSGGSLKMTTAERTKLAGIETGAEVNPTAVEVRNLYESNAGRNAFTDFYLSKLQGIEDGAQAVTNARVTSAITETAITSLDSPDRIVCYDTTLAKVVIMTYSNLLGQLRDYFDGRYSKLGHTHPWPGYNEVGSYVFAVQVTGPLATTGGTAPGSSLRASSAEGNNTADVLSGTWQKMGYTFDLGTGTNSVTVWRRIS